MKRNERKMKKNEMKHKGKIKGLILQCGFNQNNNNLLQQH